MAYGLRKITGTTYWPYGTGRDWFFVGDLDYMHGRRTPKVDVRERFEKLTPPLRKKRGHPQDMVFSQATIRSMSSTVGVASVPGVFGGKSQHPRLSIRTLERWRSLNDASFGDMNRGGELERWRQQESAARPADHSIRSSCSASLHASNKFSDMATPVALQSTSSDFGSGQRFNAAPAKLGDKYRSFSMPIRDPRRFDFIAERFHSEAL
ncbi:unnamed protein product [Symbiodinium natans]|uniref:Uncharacterized protein n=1 Tax=Symbiodinium natans TaxID=878477 RepID=A0A812MHQ8_9DINO|nr:unnamed protein product [Symbiodinium natans]